MTRRQNQQIVDNVQTDTPRADKIQWRIKDKSRYDNIGDTKFGVYHLEGDREQMMAYFIAENGEVVVLNDHTVHFDVAYWLAVEHNKMLLGIPSPQAKGGRRIAQQMIAEMCGIGESR